MQKSRKALNKTLLDKCKKACGVGVLTQTRLNLFTAMFGAGSRREHAFLFKSENSFNSRDFPD